MKILDAVKKYAPKHLISTLFAAVMAGLAIDASEKTSIITTIIISLFLYVVIIVIDSILDAKSKKENKIQKNSLTVLNRFSDGSLVHIDYENKQFDFCLTLPSKKNITYHSYKWDLVVFKEAKEQEPAIYIPDEKNFSIIITCEKSDIPQLF